MVRFYLLIICSLAPGAARAQVPLPEQPLVGSTFTADLLRALPATNNPLAVLEAAQVETISSRVPTGGLDIAPAPAIGGLLNSWTQTQFRIGDVSITDPRAGGPLLLPLLPFFDRVTTVTGAMEIDDNAPGVSMTLEPVRPGTTWSRAVEGMFAAPAFVAGVSGTVPAVDRVEHAQEGAVSLGGPLSDRVGISVAGSWRNLSHTALPSADATSDRAASAFAHFVVAATPRDEFRALGIVQRITTVASTDTVLHVQSTWERRGGDARVGWRVFGGYTDRGLTAPLPRTLQLDTLTSDPIATAIDTGAGSAQRLTAGARITPPRSSRAPTVGVDVERLGVHVDPIGLDEIRELVNGVPARLWTFRAGSAADTRAATTVAVFGSERLTSGPFTLDAGLRLDMVSAAADAAADGVRWTTWLPNVKARWHVFDTAGVALVASYRRSAYQMPLNVLSIGDAAAPFADVSRWNGGTIGPLIARVGPGTGGDPSLTRIDPGLERPTTDELVLAVRARPRRGLELELARIVKREQPLLALVDTGVASSEYTAVQVPDPSFLPDSPVGAPFVTAYSRPPGSYGRDRYLLTNRTDDPATSWALELNVRASTDRLTLMAGAALTEAVGTAAAVGFLPSQNDQDVIGNVFVDRNSATQARGQLFQDRSHVLKIGFAYRLPGRASVGSLLRYQDGQPFSRVVVAPALTQGPTLVRSYANGGSAFTFTTTVDVRVQKTFTSGRSDIAAIVDVYNLPNLGNEVSEYVVTGPAFRTPTALQPPLTAVAGLRVTF